MDACYRYNAALERIIDGDTYVLRVDLGFRVAVSVTARLRGVDAPELRTPEGKAARRYVEDLLTIPDVAGDRLGDRLVVESHKTRAGTDDLTFARWVMDVYLPGGSSLAEALVIAGVARRV